MPAKRLSYANDINELLEQAKQPASLSYILDFLKSQTDLGKSIIVVGAPDYSNAGKTGQIANVGYSNGKTVATPSFAEGGDVKFNMREFFAVNCHPMDNNVVSHSNFVFFEPYKNIRPDPNDDNSMNQFMALTIGGELGMTKPFKKEGDTLYLGYVKKTNSPFKIGRKIIQEFVWETSPEQNPLTKKEIKNEELEYFKTLLGLDPGEVEIITDLKDLQVYSETYVIALPQKDMYKQLFIDNTMKYGSNSDYPLWVRMNGTAKDTIAEIKEVVKDKPSRDGRFRPGEEAARDLPDAPEGLGAKLGKLFGVKD